MINGIMNIYKEAGFTSHDVVAKLRGIVGQRKIGHTGTLDPDAVGVLPVCFGTATKLCDMMTDKSKEYEVCMRLGVTTDTQDMSGTVLCENEVTADEVAVISAIMSFVGGYEQIPPMYSALKVDGKRLYELARQGKEIERQPRHVDIPQIRITDSNVDITSLDFIFYNDKANASTVTQEAFKACEADVQKESEQQNAIYELAKQNAVNVLTALINPIVEQLGTEYTLIID